MRSGRFLPLYTTKPNATLAPPKGVPTFVLVLISTTQTAFLAPLFCGTRLVWHGSLSRRRGLLTASHASLPRGHAPTSLARVSPSLACESPSRVDAPVRRGRVPRTGANKSRRGCAGASISCPCADDVSSLVHVARRQNPYRLCELSDVCARSPLLVRHALTAAARATMMRAGRSLTSAGRSLICAKPPTVGSDESLSREPRSETCASAYLIEAPRSISGSSTTRHRSSRAAHTGGATSRLPLLASRHCS